MGIRLSRAFLLDLFSGPLPGEQAQRKMAPVFRGRFALSEAALDAAVVFLIYEEDGHFRTLFIRRNEYPGPHSAQVSLPGGMREPEDASLEATAMRELIEETGVTGMTLYTIGQLTPLHIPVSNINVTPFVIWGEGKPHFDPDPGEVQYLITPSLLHLFNNNTVEEECTEREGESFTFPFYRCGEDKIWGATAMMISELKELICSVQPIPEL